MSPSLPPSDAPDQFRTPSQSPPATSPVTSVPQTFAEHKRDEVQAFVYDKDIHEVEDFKNRKEFFSLLKVPEGVMAKFTKDSGKSGNENNGKSGEKSSGKVSGEDPSHFSRKNFVREANTLAESMKNDYFPPKTPLLVFKSTDNQIPLGRLPDTQCRPNITAAFDIHWDNKPTTLWPCIRVAGEVASAGKKKEDQMKQAISYLHYLLLARPDLHVAQGFLISKERITFLFGIGGRGIRRLATSWTDPQMMKLMFAFFYRVYEPGHFGDASYVEMVPDFQGNFVKYTIRITQGDGVKDLDCPGFYPLYATSPFGSRTHILSHPESDICCNGKILTVVKDQLSRPDSRFDEYTILTSHVHSPETVPGVVEAVCHEMIELPQSLGVSKVKHRLGLRQLGSPLMSIPTLREMLEVVFDVLEVLRFLRVNREVLHRDISKGNVLYIPKRTTPPPHTSQKEVPICFIKYLLGDSTVPQETSVLLIDFNHAEHLGSKQRDGRTPRIGTPIFIARAVQQGSPMLPPEIAIIPAIPSPDSYALHHPDRIERFPLKEPFVFNRPSPNSPDRPDRQWRHELDHDVESVFWLLLYWLVLVQPLELPEEFIDSASWSTLTGNIVYRDGLLSSLSAQKSSEGLTHSFYRPVFSLLYRLAHILVVDRHWLEKSDKRNHPEYVVEAFQRLILQFVLHNKEKKFMTKTVARKPRTVQVVPQHPSLLNTPTTDMDGRNRKRPSPSPSTQHQKRPRLDAEKATEDHEVKHLSKYEDYEDEEAVFEDQTDSDSE